MAYLAHEYDTATALLERALSLDPNSAEVHHSAGWVWNFACDGFRASDHFERAMALIPLDPEIGHSLIGQTFSQLMMVRYEIALDTSRKAMAAAPASVSPLRARIVALVQLDRLDEARSVGRALRALDPEFSIGNFRKVQPFRDDAFVECYMSALSLAEIPV